METPRLPATPAQGILPLKPARDMEIDGIQMGVMPDGTAYVTGRGLAAMCGVVHSVIQDLANDWPTEQSRPRGREIANILSDQGYSGPLHIPIEVNGSSHNAFPDIVCMAILEYYAFVANPSRVQATRNYRLLGRSSLKAFIYTQVGYDPTNRIPESWAKFHDRLSLNYNTVPHGYFSIFKEMSDIIVSLIQGGLPVDEHTVPDGSVGIHWGKKWTDEAFDSVYGPRIKYEHNFPDNFPQAMSNPQHPWAYPEKALPDFRKWMREVYLPLKLPTYLKGQESKRALPPSISSLVLESLAPMMQALPDTET